LGVGVEEEAVEIGGVVKDGEGRCEGGLDEGDGVLSGEGGIGESGSGIFR
jgi:hypothetical protein